MWNNFVLFIFTVEITMKIIACHPNYREWFHDGWNNLDFVCVLVALFMILIAPDGQL